MNRIDRCFADLKQRKERALICFLTGGDPDLETTGKLVSKIAECGADIVELGIPFSDPLADGPSIQLSAHRALKAGTTVGRVLEQVKSIREHCEVPIIFMTYYNPVQKYGLERFANEAAEVGGDGVIMTDLPPEEAGAWRSAAENTGLATIFLLAPTSTKDRIELVANMASGFIYCVSRTGVTGARDEVPADLKGLVGRIKAASSLPVVVGFGISRPEHVGQVTEFADGAVVGSALINVIADCADSNEIVERAGEFVRSLKEGAVVQG